MAWSDAAREAALQARRMHTRLFHGTTTKAGGQIEPRPNYMDDTDRYRKVVFLSTSTRDAREYAKAAADKFGGKPVVHMVRVGKQPGLKLISTDGPGKHAWWTASKPLKNSKQYKVKK